MMLVLGVVLILGVGGGAFVLQGVLWDRWFGDD